MKSFNQICNESFGTKIEKDEEKKEKAMSIELFVDLKSRTARIDQWLKQNVTLIPIKRSVQFHFWLEDVAYLRNHLLQYFLIQNVNSTLTEFNLNDLQFMLLSNCYFASNIDKYDRNQEIDIQRVINANTRLSLFSCQPVFNEEESLSLLYDVSYLITCYYRQGKELLLDLIKKEELNRLNLYKVELKKKEVLDDMFYDNMKPSYISLLQPTPLALLKEKDGFTLRLIPFKPKKKKYYGEEEDLQKNWTTPVETGYLFEEHPASFIDRFIPVACSTFVDYWFQTSFIKQLDILPSLNHYYKALGLQSESFVLSDLEYTRCEIRFQVWLSEIFKFPTTDWLHTKLVKTIFESEMPLGSRYLIRRDLKYKYTNIESEILYQIMTGASRMAFIQEPLLKKIPYQPENNQYYQVICLTLFHYSVWQNSIGQYDFLQKRVIFGSQLLQAWSDKEFEKDSFLRIIQLTGKIYILNKGYCIYCKNWLTAIINFCHLLKYEYQWWLKLNEIQIDEWNERLFE